MSEQLDPRGQTTMPDCPACQAKRLHAPEAWLHHPLAGHGYARETGWTRPEAQIAYESQAQENQAQERAAAI